MSNGLDPDQDLQFVGPDLGPNSLQRLSADDQSPQQRKIKNLDSCACISIYIYSLKNMAQVSYFQFQPP